MAEIIKLKNELHNEDRMNEHLKFKSRLQRS